MKRIYVAAAGLMGITVALFGCLKGDPTPACTGYTLAQDKVVIDSFLNANGMTGSFTYDGGNSIYYRVANPGTGSAPAADSLVTYAFDIRVIGAATSFNADTVRAKPYGSFTSFENFVFSKLKEDGVMNIIVPSSFQYGCSGARNPSTGQQVVPPNAQIYYTMKLISVQQGH